MEEGDNEDNEKKRQFVKKLRAAGGLLQFLLSLIPLSLKNPKRKAAKNIVIKRNPHNPNKRYQSFAAPTANVLLVLAASRTTVTLSLSYPNPSIPLGSLLA